MIDALVPLINHLEVSEVNYNPDHIRSEMVLEKENFIKSESKELWKLTEELVQESVEKGLYFKIPWPSVTTFSPRGSYLFSRVVLTGLDLWYNGNR